MTEPLATTEAEDPLALAGDLRAVLGQLNRRLREQTDSGDFTRSQVSVLIRLEREGPTTMSALARAEGVRPQSMGAIISVLQAAGVVGGDPDPRDGRKILLSLTDEARERFTTGRLAKEDWLFRAISKNLTPAEQDHLAACVELLRRIADSS